MDTSNTPIDNNALTLTHAIGLAESGNATGQPNYNLIGDNGTAAGAYQWSNGATPLQQGQVPANFQSDAKQFGLNPTDFSPVNQDKVAYAKIEYLKNQENLQPAEIASVWNSGQPNNWQNNIGTKIVNGKPLSYNTPAYVKNVQNYYNKLYQPNPSSTNNVAGQTDNTQSPQPDLISQLGGRLNEAVGGIGETMGGVGNLLTSKPNPGSSVASIAQGPLHIAGALAGGLGDITNSILDQVPLVKPLENLIGQGVGMLAQTPTGQSILTQYKDFSTKNPELVQDAGDVFNIVTAIPILKGIGAVKNIGMDAISQVAKSTAEKSYAEGLGEIITKDGKSKLGKMFLADNPDIGKELVGERAGLNLENGRFVTKGDIENSWNKINSNGDEIQQILDTANKGKYTVGTEDPDTILNNTLNGYTDRNGVVQKALSNSEFTPQEILDNGRKLTPQNGKIWTKFTNGDATLSDINNLRSDLDTAVQKSYSSAFQPPIHQQMGMDLAGAMRDFVQTQAPETQALFADITKQFRIQKALGLLEGQSPNMGTVGSAIKIAGTLGGEKIGEAMGVHPLISAGIGYRLTSAAEKLHPFSLSRNILERTAPDAIPQTLKSLGWLSGAPIQRAVNPQNNP